MSLFVKIQCPLSLVKESRVALRFAERNSAYDERVTAKRLQRCAEHRRSLGGAIPMYGLALAAGTDETPTLVIGPETGQHEGSGLIYTGVAQLGQSSRFQTCVSWVQILPSVLLSF